MPTREQVEFLLGCTGAARVGYNYAVEKISAYQQVYKAEEEAGVPKKERTKPLTVGQIYTMWTDEREERTSIFDEENQPTGETWWGLYHSDVFNYAFRNGVQAHKNFMKGAGFPNFKRKSTAKRTVKFGSKGNRLLPGAVHIGCVGTLEVVAADPAQKCWRRRIRRDRARLVSVTISSDKSGRWYASLLMERVCDHDHAGRPAPVTTVGVDVGVKNLVVAATPDGTEILSKDGIKALRHQKKRLRRLQRRLSRQDLAWSKEHGTYEDDNKVRASKSSTREKTRHQIAVLHRKVRDTRSTLLHQASAELVSKAAELNAAVILETLNVKGMVSKGGAHKKGLNKAIHDAALGELHRQLAYKTTKLLGEGYLERAPRSYPSSKTCSRCQTVRTKLSLSERTFRCVNEDCGLGYELDRDINAAINLALWGQTELGLQLSHSQSGDRDGPGPLGEDDRTSDSPRLPDGEGHAGLLSTKHTDPNAPLVSLPAETPSVTGSGASYTDTSSLGVGRRLEGHKGNLVPTEAGEASCRS